MTTSLYIDLVKRVLTDQIHHPSRARLGGKDWPELVFTMIGIARLDNIQKCCASILQENIPGDFLEAGVWRGGAAIFMKALLAEAAIKDRKVWLADSFQLEICRSAVHDCLASRSLKSQIHKIDWTGVFWRKEY